ncbi:MAG: hypothetical protein ACK5B6_05865 [Bacteroidia bacterium]|jgi:hypothetical protein
MIKKALFSVLFACACNLGFAADAALFDVNEQELSTEFAQLNELEQYVNANEGVTFSSMDANNPLLENVSAGNSALGVVSSLAEAPLGIPSFLWGFCFNVAGVAIVYFVANDSEETRKAFIGCAVSGGLYILWWVFWVLVAGNAFLFF